MRPRLFGKILIANRGEIACRIARTARRLGIATVAVYSEADRNALHVAMADEAVLIGPAAAGQSYLSIERIVEACRQTGAEAVHPGYGFLSERAEFARALAAARIAFIGPNPAAIDAMGDKIESKKAAAQAGVSTVPGFLGVIEDADRAVAIAEDIGYPVMIKASAGGGGKGMRIARSAADIRDGFERARSEARSSFGDDRVFIEKFIAEPRHVEIQVLGDKHGNVIHLGERECSIQRRNQKVVEESPSPLLDAASRAEMGAQAVALAKAVGYDSAGTIEFVAGQDRSFYFLEMNTRLQVEHPVTELVTGIDLVEQMIRIAAGERLAHAQEDVRLAGWAIESRVYAEDATRGFLPSIGRITRYAPPPEGTRGSVTVRVDSGVVEGGEVSIHYDPLVAKLVTHGATRAAAVDAQAEALDRFVVDGIRHNIPFLAALMAHPRWRDGRLSTGFIAEEFPDGFAVPLPDGDAALHLALIGTHIDHMENARKRDISGQMPGRRVVFDRQRVVVVGPRTFRLAVTDEPGGHRIDWLSDQGDLCESFQIKSAWRLGERIWTGTINGSELAVQVARIPNGVHLAHGGAAAALRVYSRNEARLAALMPAKTTSQAGKALLAPMPGVVLQIAVSAGQEVRAGDTLVIIEAMKMENVLRAERDVKVKAVRATAGQSLAVDAVLIEFE